MEGCPDRKLLSKNVRSDVAYVRGGLRVLRTTLSASRARRLFTHIRRSEARRILWKQAKTHGRAIRFGRLIEDAVLYSAVWKLPWGA